MKRVALVISLVVLLIFPSMNGVHGRETPKIVFDEYHATWKPSQHLYDIQWALEDEGYTVEFSEGRIDSSLLSKEKCDVFVVFIPRRYYDDNEKEAIKSFVESGGGLIIFGEHGGYMDDRGITNPVNDVSKIFGIQFNQNVVLDEEKNREGEDCWPVISSFASHPVTKGVKSMVYICGCDLGLRYPATALAFGNSTTTANGEKGKDVVVLAAAEYGNGRVVAVGDQGFIVGSSSPRYEQTDFLSFEDNKKLALNMFEWTAQGIDIGEADISASEGNTLFSEGKYSQAKVRFEKAQRTYSKANMTDRVSEMQTMIDKCGKGIDAEAALEKGMEYYEENEYNYAVAEFQRSKSLYDELGNSTGSQQAQLMIDACNKALKRLDAEAAYTAGKGYFDEGSYESALTEFEKSKSLYDELGDNEGSLTAQERIDTCNKALNAEAAYEKGMTFYEKEEYELAISTFEEAIPLYEEIGNDEKAKELESKIEEVETALAEKNARNKKIIIVGILVAVVVAFVAVYVLKVIKGPEDQVPDAFQPETVVCNMCGKENVKGALYCKYCKAPLKPLDELEKEKMLEDVRKKHERGDITEEEYHRIVKSLKEGFQ